MYCKQYYLYHWKQKRSLGDGLAIKDGNKMAMTTEENQKKISLMSGQEVFAIMIDNWYSENNQNW